MSVMQKPSLEELQQKEFRSGMEAGYDRFPIGEQVQTINEQDVYFELLQRGHRMSWMGELDHFESGYFIGWMIALFQLPISDPTGQPSTKYAIRLSECKVALSNGNDFLAGYMIGHLKFMRLHRHQSVTYQEICNLLVAALDEGHETDDMVAGKIAGVSFSAFQKGYFPNTDKTPIVENGGTNER